MTHQGGDAALEARRTARSRAAFVAFLGTDAAADRAAAIAALDVKAWRGRPVHRLRCRGATGRGPHDVWVPAAVLWTLIDLRVFRCPFHAGAPLAE